MDNVFLVACSRSGTTLLQSMLATHPRIISFPETHFFHPAMPINPILRRLKLYGNKERQRVLDFLNTYGFDLDPFDENAGRSFHHRWCCTLIEVLEKMAREQAQKNDIRQPACWVEKTPRHLHYISSIEGTGCEPKFIHMLRRGKDVVASMHLASKNNPEEWKGVRPIKKCIRWWKTDVKISFRYQGQSNHFFAVYGQLIDEPEEVLKPLCQFLNVEYTPKMATQFHRSAPGLIAKEESWKARNTKRTLRKSTKLQDNFDESTIRYITRKTASVDLSSFYH